MIDRGNFLVASSNDYPWVVAFEKKGNLLKDLVSDKYRVIYSVEQALYSDFTDLMIDDESSVLNKNLFRTSHRRNLPKHSNIKLS